MATQTVDNLLYFVASKFDCLDRQHLNSLLVDFYELDEFITSKAILIAECDKISISETISEYKKKHKTFLGGSKEWSAFSKIDMI